MRGIDISNHNGNIDFVKAKNSGIEMVYIKATEGTTYQDPYRDINYNGATDAGLPTGFYHYLVGSSAPETQAENFYNSIKGKNNTLRPCLDLEATGFNIMDYTLRFISKFTELSGLPIVIYSSPYFINKNLDSRLAIYPLWVAHYDVNTPMSNNVWGDNYVGHQYTDKGTVNGITGYVDLNNFYDGIFVFSNPINPIIPPQTPEQIAIEKGKNYIGSRCKELQQKLIAKGYDCGGYGADGVFGQATYYSLLQFQRDNGLASDGLAGPQTFQKLNSNLKDSVVVALQTQINKQGFGNIAVDGIAGNATISHAPMLKLGASGEITRTMQKLLNRKGNNIGLDGIFGQTTLNAVKAFQKRKGLTADGIVGKQTWAKLLAIP